MGSGSSLVISSVSVEVSNREVVLTWLSSGIRLAIRSWTSGFFECAISAIASDSFSGNSYIVGLLGSPSGNITDDWMDTDGNILPDQWIYPKDCTNGPISTAPQTGAFEMQQIPSSRMKGVPRLKTSMSVMLHLIPVRSRNASATLTELCGTNEACLIDGLIGGTNDTQNVLEEQAAAVEASQWGRFRFSPASIQTGFSYNVAITADYSDDTV